MVERLLLADLLVALPDAPAAGEVVHPERGCIGARHGLGDDAITTEERNEERQRRDQVRCVVEEALALGEVLVDEAKLTLLEVTDAAVDHLRGLRRRTRGEVALLDQRRPQSAAGGIERHAGPGDPTADDQHVELLVGKAAQSIVAAKGVHRSSLPHPLQTASGPWPPSGWTPRRRAVVQGGLEDGHRGVENATLGFGPCRCRPTTTGRVMRGRWSSSSCPAASPSWSAPTVPAWPARGRGRGPNRCMSSLRGTPVTSGRGRR